ncbi:MAG: hypothetical protein J0L72_04210 [Armatimonadetes bacterium]|nr:hypothetical protein [Armatimonadota bacterium]
MIQLKVHPSSDSNSLALQLKSNEKLSVSIEAAHLHLLKAFCDSISSMVSRIYELEVVISGSAESPINIDVGMSSVRFLNVTIERRPNLDLKIKADRIDILGIFADTSVKLDLHIEARKLLHLTLKKCKTALYGNCLEFKSLALLMGTSISCTEKRVHARSVRFWTTSSKSLIRSIDHQSVKELNVFTSEQRAKEALELTLENLEHLSLSALRVTNDVLCLSRYPAIKSMELCDVRIDIDTLNQIVDWNNINLSMQFCRVEQG